jgi:type I restriction enzyme M protein
VTMQRRLSMTDVARLSGVRPSAVSNWRTRYADFPAASRSSGQESFRAAEIARWLAGRKIAKNDLKAGEAPGDTYADRFLRNLGVPTVTTRDEPPAVNRVRRMLPWMLRLQANGDPRAAAELVLGLLCLRLREPSVWKRLTAQRRASAMRELLAGIHMQAGPYDRRFYPFRRLGSMPAADSALVELVRAIGSFGFSKPDDIAQLGSYLLAAFERAAGRRGGDYFTPAELARCMVKLIDPQAHDSVYDPFCRAGELLSAAAVHVSAPDALSLAGQASNEQSWELTSLNLALHGIDVDLGGGPSLAIGKDQHATQRFDVVLANPPFNLRLWEESDVPDDTHWPYGAPPRDRANFAWLQHVAEKLAPGGRAAVLMPNAATNSEDNAEANIRARMVAAGVIECVIALPPQLFSSTEIPVSLWMLRATGGEPPDDILFMDASGLGVKNDRAQRTLTGADRKKIVGEYRAWRDHPSGGTPTVTAGFSRAVALDEIRERRYLLDPHAYVKSAASEASVTPPSVTMDDLRADLEELRTRSAAVRKEFAERLSRYVAQGVPASWRRASLGDVCTVVTGPATVDRKNRQQPGIPFVTPRNIRDNRLVGEFDGVNPQFAAAKLARYQLEPGDVICTRIGAAVRAGQVSPEQAGWLVGPGCLRLRPAEHVDPGYLTCYLSSPGALQWLDRHAIVGTAIMHISARRLVQMPLLLPPMSVQRVISELLGALDEELAIQDRISASTRRLRNLWLSRLMSADPGHGE